MLNVIRKTILLMVALLIPLPVGAAGASAGSIVLFAVTELVVVVLISVFFFRKMQNSRRENENNRYYDRQTGVLNRAVINILRFLNKIINRKWARKPCRATCWKSVVCAC